ncbi:MAG: recombinase family protein [Lachnospiraceae bacterium]|nr:recombinase family protein [Lachnospiraceae bacterium]
MRFQTKEKEKTLCAGYVRLSQEDGDKPESNSIHNQKELIKAFYKKHPEMIPVDEYVDDGYTGTNYDRPGFARLMEDVDKGKVNCIVVKDLSRLGRNHIETGRYIEQIFPALGIRFIAINDHYDSANEENESDRIIVPFKNLINDAYCRDISIKVRSQLDVKRRDGQFVGSFAGYGYKKDPVNKNHLIIDEYAAGIVRQIFEWRLDGMSLLRIAQRLDEMGVLPPMEYKRACNQNYNSGFRAKADQKWSAVCVNRILRNESYTGTMVQGKRKKINYKVKQIVDVAEEEWIRVEGTHDAIVSKSIFEQVQKMFDLDTRTAPQEETVYLFSGFLRCGDCGQNLVMRSTTRNGKKYVYYHCSTYKNGDGCSSHLISEKKLTEAVLNAIRSQAAMLVDAEHIIAAAQSLPDGGFGAQDIKRQIVALDAEAERYRELKQKLYEDMRDGLVGRDEYQEINARFSNKMREALEKREKAEAKRKKLLSGGSVLQPWLKDFCQYKEIRQLDRWVLTSLVDRIIVYSKDSIEVQFRFRNEMQELLNDAGKTTAGRSAAL